MADHPRKHKPVLIRMYRHGLGDFFLIRFPTATAKTINVVIDCGVVLGARQIEGQDAPVERLRQAVEDMLTTVKNRIDLLIVTHEHWDHVSGFAQARDLFEADDVKIERLWLAWTEDPDDERAREIREERRRRMNVLKAAISMTVPTPGARPRPIETLQGFFGPLGAKDSVQTADAFNWIKDRVENKEYLRPGAKVDVPGTKGMQAYVLGPPLEKKFLNKSKPSQSREEIYLTDDVLRLTGELSAFADSHDGAGLERPFGQHHGLSVEQATVHPFFRERYGFTPDMGEPWRRIDNDWLALADQLALQLDSNTNNTSLVLAFQLPNDDVLLFPGDAQIGSWFSWHEVKWEGEETTAADLLGKTVFYKCAHHASMNATLGDQGMELMPEGFAAMIPVNETQAHAKRWNDMPYDKLLEAMERKRAVVMRMDIDDDSTPRPGVTIEDLFIEYELKA